MAKGASQLYSLTEHTGARWAPRARCHHCVDHLSGLSQQERIAERKDEVGTYVDVVDRPSSFLLGEKIFHGRYTVIGRSLLLALA